MASGANQARRQDRRWHFGNAVFDERSWQLTVAGSKKPLEGKPLDILHELLLHAGSVVSKEQLLDEIWPNVHVVEGSVSTALSKLRSALEDSSAGQRIIETVPRIGYRLACSVTCETTLLRATPTAPRVPPPRQRLAGYAVGLLVFGAGVSVLAFARPGFGSFFDRPPTTAEVLDAARHIDEPRFKAMLQTGWDPNSPLDDQGNTALNAMLSVCEWNPQHDKATMLQAARTLLEGGTRLDFRNYWGDTAYSIAKAERYCGPDHPVTMMLKASCYNGYGAPGDKCLADYKHSAAARNGGKLPG